MGIMCRSRGAGSTIPPNLGESSPLSKLIKVEGVSVYISGAIITYKFIISSINILISYIN